MVQTLHIKDYWTKHKVTPLFDVRTPAEYTKGHIPNAHNLPLFSDEERAMVGTLYKKESPQAALLKGLDLVGPKMRTLIEQVQTTTDTTSIAVHCWRGGKRSQSVGWLLNMAGYQVTTLQGGYKSFRQYLHTQLDTVALPLIVIGGKTGSGKTKILHELAIQGEQIIDLEGLANHKGSAFGFIGEPNQPSTEQFENNLFDYIQHLDHSKRVWIENENRGIGSIYLPATFWQQLKKSPLLNIEIPLASRVQNLIQDYTVVDADALKEGFYKIRKRLGGVRYQRAIQHIEAKELSAAATIALDYYDKTYQYMLETNTTPAIHKLQFSSPSPTLLAKDLIKYANERML